MSLLKRIGLRQARQLITTLPLLARIAWRLTRDPRVPRRHKAVMLAAVGYVVSPFDLAPDVIPYFGRVDDLLIVAAGVGWALRFAPRDVVDEHLSALATSREDLTSLLAEILPLPIEALWRKRNHILPDS